MSRWNMICSEKRLPLFGIMLDDRIYSLLALALNLTGFSAE